MKLEHFTCLLCWDFFFLSFKKVRDVNKLRHQKFLQWISTTHSFSLTGHNATMQRCIANAHLNGNIWGIAVQVWYSADRQRQPFLDQKAIAGIQWMKGWWWSGQTISSCHKNWLKSRYSTPCRKMKTKNTQRMHVCVCVRACVRVWGGRGEREREWETQERVLIIY